MSKKNGFQIAVNVFLAAGTLYAFYLMYFRNAGLLLAKGFAAFKYFTVLSNAFGGVMAVVWLIAAASGMKGRGMRIISLLKFTAAVCLGLTFAVVMLFLGWIYGYIAMLRSANLWFHLLIPLAAMAEYVFLNREKMGVKSCLAAMLPMMAYASFYLTYNLIMGRGEYPLQYDWYGFLLWGWGVGFGIFTVICLATFGIGAFLRYLNAKITRRLQKK